MTDTKIKSMSEIQKKSASYKRGPRKTKMFGKQEFDQKLVDLRRVARVVAGGRRFSFRATLVVGDRKGRVGVGVAKARDTTMAIEKAVRQAKKKMINIPLNKNYSVLYPVYAKYNAARVMIKPASEDVGLSAGGAVRVVLDLAGVRNATAKILSRSRSKINNARAALKALSQYKV